MSISLVEAAGANFRTDETSDALNTAFMGRLGMRKRYLPARLAVSRSLAMPAPPLPLDEGHDPGKVIKGDTLFGTGTALSVWLSLVIERSEEEDVDAKRLIALVGAHWKRGLQLLDKEWDQADGDVAQFVKRLVEVAELPATGGKPYRTGNRTNSQTFSNGAIDVPIGEISEEVGTKERIIWGINEKGGSPHSAIMGGVGTGKTRTAVAMLAAIRESAPVPLLAFDFKGDLGTDASGGGYHVEELFEAKVLDPPRVPIPLDALSYQSQILLTYFMMIRDQCPGATAQERRVVLVMTSGWSVSHCHAVRQASFRAATSLNTRLAKRFDLRNRTICSIGLSSGL